VVSLSGETFVDRPVDVVFDFVADERNRYDPRIRRAQLITAGPIGAGTQFRSEGTSLGRPVEMIIEFTTYERPRRLGSTTYLSAMQIHSSLTFEPHGSGTRMRWSSTLQPRGLLKVLTPLLAAAGRRQMSKVWANLKRTLEAQGEEQTHGYSVRNHRRGDGQAL
jgi:hypothetical protein